MKKAILVLIVLFLGVCVLVEAQDSGTKSSFYAKTVPVYKIYSYALGYKVVYHKVGLQLGIVYLPFTWFSKVDSPGDVVTGVDPSYPYFTIFYRDGKIDHVRLFVQENHEHLTWATLRISAEEANKYFNTDFSNLKVEY